MLKDSLYHYNLYVVSIEMYYCLKLQKSNFIQVNCLHLYHWHLAFWTQTKLFKLFILFLHSPTASFTTFHQTLLLATQKMNTMRSGSISMWICMSSFLSTTCSLKKHFLFWVCWLWHVHVIPWWGYWTISKPPSFSSHSFRRTCQWLCRPRREQQWLRGKPSTWWSGSWGTRRTRSPWRGGGRGRGRQWWWKVQLWVWGKRKWEGWWGRGWSHEGGWEWGRWWWWYGFIRWVWWAVELANVLFYCCSYFVSEP